MICAFEKDSPRISAIEINDWIYKKLQFPEQDVLMAQMDGIHRHVNIKVRDPGILEDVIAQNNGALTYEHNEGVISNAAISMAGLGKQRIRIANLPPALCAATVREIREEMCSSYIDIRCVTESKW
jgi:hypothetical protein